MLIIVSLGFPWNGLVSFSRTERTRESQTRHIYQGHIQIKFYVERRVDSGSPHSSALYDS